MLASNSEEILKILEMFKDFLSLGNFWNYSMRWLGWFLIQGISLLVDGLESVTDTILGTKTFFASQGVQDFVATIQPYLYILLALSFLYVGYMMIFNKKINREQIAINVFISIAVLFLLSPGMVKVDKFTDEAIKVVKDTGEGTLSQKIVKENLTDVSLFVENNFSSTELEESNRIPEEKIMKVDITEKVDEDFKLAGDKKIEDKAKQVLTNKSDMNNHGEETLVKLKDGWFDFFPQKYYRWHWNFWTITITLCMMGFTLLLVSIKIAKLSFELTFNYILAIIIAPADISTGQKLKEVLKSILNAFAVIIMIFISLKVYMLGTTYIAENLSGVAYLISLIAFSIVVIKGPSMVERVFGISGGSQDSIPVLTGAANTAVTTANLAKRGASKLGSGAVTAGAGIAGFASGFKAGGKNPNEMNSEMKNQQDEGKKQKNSLSDQSRDKDKDINGNDKKDLSLQDQMQGQQEEKKSNPEGAQTLEQQMKESGFKGNSQPSKFAQSEQNGNQVSNVPLTSINEGNPSHQDNERLEGVSQQDMDSPFANVSPAGEAKGDVTNTDLPSKNGMNSDTGSTVHSDMKSTGFSESSLSSTSNNQDVSNQEQASINNNGSTVQQDMQSTGFTSNASSSNDTSSSNQTVSSQEYASINDSGSTVQQDMQSSGFTSSSSSNDDPSPRIVETNVDTTSSPLIQQEAARSEMQTTQQQVASTSTNSEPISSVSPSQNVVSTQRETRTGGEYLRDRINSNQVVQRAKRTYQISRNTGLRMRNRNNRND